jgi:hypothetical protein
MNDHDPLAQFRREGAPAPAPPSRSMIYGAFAIARDRPARLGIRPGAGDLCYAPSYASLLNIAYDREYTGFILTFSSLLVKVDGIRMKAIVESLIAGTCQYIEEFDAARWLMPGDDVPIIHSITIHTGKAGADRA